MLKNIITLWKCCLFVFSISVIAWYIDPPRTDGGIIIYVLVVLGVISATVAYRILSKNKMLTRTSIGNEDPTRGEFPVSKESSGKSIVKASLPNRRVFIVHGRDTGSAYTVAHFVKQLGLEDIILQDEPSGGNTVIEKFEAYSEVGYVIVVMTPDDVGGLKGQDMQPRARQNVIFELGYFFGKLGRKKVCAITFEKTEIPSDMSGIVTVPFDDHGGWQMKLQKELRTSGYILSHP